MAPLTLKQKIDLIEENKINKNQTSLASKFKCSRSTVQNILKRKAELVDAYDNHAPGDRKRTKICKFDDVDTKVWQWFMSARSANLAISGPLIQEKAITVANELGLTDFKASNGWLEKFRKRHNVTFGAVSGEGASVDQATVDDWKARLTQHLKDYPDPKDRYNLDETGLVLRGLPDKTMRVKGEGIRLRERRRVKVAKKSKERITVSLMCNQAGEFEKPIVIGRCKNPRAFKHVKPRSPSFPVVWHFNKNAWMTSDIFEPEMKRFNEKMKRQRRKVILFIDNATCHPIVHLSNVKIVFLPPNTTSHLQPLDQGIIKAMKMHYRKLVLSKILREHGSGNDVSKLNKLVSILDAIYWISQSVKQIAASTVTKCFLRCGFTQENVPDSIVTDETDHFDADDDVSLATLVRRWQSDVSSPEADSVDEYVNFDDNVECCAAMDVVDFLTLDRDTAAAATEVEDADEDYDEPAPRPRPTRSQLFASLDLLSDFCRYETLDDELDMINAFAKTVNRKLDSNVKQSDIRHFFS